MDEFYNLAISLHVGIVYVALIMAGINFYILKKQSPKKLYRNLLPLYYMILASLAFTGLVMINYMANFISIGLMSVALIFILVTTIKTYKSIKYKRELDRDLLKKMQKKYLLDMGIYLLFIIYGRYHAVFVS